MDVHAMKDTSLRDELRLHARYIRDTLAPILSRQSKLLHSDVSLLRSILRRLESVQITLDLLRYSRMEKALMVVAEGGALAWPMEAAEQAEELIQKWEDELGPLKNLRSDLYGPGGRLEGVQKIVDGKKACERDDEAKSAWAVKVQDPNHSHKYGSLGYEVGDWWLKPAVAYRDGIIDQTSHAITADANGAYAVVVSGNRELELQANGRFAYHAALDDPGALKLSKTLLGSTEKVVRVLRSWKLRSPLAPKAGLRYDGLYRIESFGIKLIPPNSWHKTFTLARLRDQSPITAALQYPMSDQLDDWRDYQRLKNIDRGEDFAMLREMLQEPISAVSGGIEAKGETMVRGDSGYFSRRSSKISSRLNSIPEVEEIVQDFKRMAKDSSSQLSNQDYGMIAAAIASTAEGAHHFFDPTKPESTVDREGHNFDPDLRHMDRVIRHQTPEATAEILRRADADGIHRPQNPHDWPYEWQTKSSVLDGAEEGAFFHRTFRINSGNDEDEELDPTDHGRNQATAENCKSCWFKEDGIWRNELGGPDEVEEIDFIDWASTNRCENDDADGKASEKAANKVDEPKTAIWSSRYMDPDSDREDNDSPRMSKNDQRDWVYGDGVWRSESGLDGVEERDFTEWASRSATSETKIS